MSPDAVLRLGLVAVFLGVVLALTTIGVLTAERLAIGRSLAAIRAIRSAPRNMQRELDRPFGERVIGPSAAWLTQMARWFSPSGSTQRIRSRLDLAGNPPGWDVDRILAFKSLGLLVGIGITGVMGLLVRPGALQLLGLLVVACLTGWALPSILLVNAAQRRSAQIRKDLPDAMDLLTISVEAGLGFDAAVAQVARKTEGPVADEFFRVLQEMQIGRSRSDAMRRLGERTDVDELRGFVGAVVQAEQFGIPVANVLRVQAHEMRVKRRQWAEEAAQKVPVKILFPLVFFILPSLFVVILGPAAVQIYRTLIEGGP